MESEIVVSSNDVEYVPEPRSLDVEVCWVEMVTPGCIIPLIVALTIVVEFQVVSPPPEPVIRTEFGVSDRYPGTCNDAPVPMTEFETRVCVVDPVSDPEREIAKSVVPLPETNSPCALADVFEFHEVSVRSTVASVVAVAATAP